MTVKNTQQMTQDHQEIHDRVGRRRAEVELADRHLDEVDREEGRRIAGAAAGQTKGSV